MPTDFRTSLARSTRAAHVRVERELDLQNDVGAARYAAYLRAMHTIVSALEGELLHDERFVRFELAMRRKTRWLERDLRHFECPVPERPPREIPHAFPERVGWLYVIEGSTLGGRVLYRQLAPRLALSPDCGGAFLHGYGERTAPMWHAFESELSALVFTPEDEKACIGSAIQAFDAVRAAFRASIACARLRIGGDDG